ncbi:proteinase-activated receptor 1-like [Dunckerocampus dactyliophorus]|uniref:proteinase-activated receptor 1-like n=1 Tax=Dunckerocampus dactyliophorus TaxID=161453 RepID=UPI0024059AD3|nr:proteinase-activated receptor 1-like [Dunckerocampus dactyliophorus]
MPADVPRTLLLLLLCAASAAGGNSSARGRTFGLFDVTITDEPFTLGDLYGHDVDLKVKRTSRVGNVTTRGPAISEAALQFLRGRVSTILIPSFYTLVCLVSVPINICAVLAFTRRIRPKKPAAVYMLNLACADLIFASLLPFKVAYHFGGNNWMFGEVMCRVLTAAFYWNMYCSVLLIACISVDRLLAVVYPIDSLTWRRPRIAMAACVTMWILSLAASVPLVISEQTVHLKELNITTCHDVQSVDQLIGRYKAFFITLCCTLFVVPLLVTVVSYARVIWSLSAVPRGVPARSRRKSRAVVMALTVLVIFLLCFAPTNCLLLFHYVQLHRRVQDAPEDSYAAYLVFLCLGSLNCLLDPLLYFFGSSQCQRELAGLLRCQKIAESFSRSSSDSYRSSTRTILKSGRTDTSRINASVTKQDSLQGNLGGEYKKLVV